MKKYIVRARKLVTVSEKGTIYDGALAVVEGKIADLGNYREIRQRYGDIPVLDFDERIVAPTLADCHTHILEYAPDAIFPVTDSTHLMGGISLLLGALSCGITALGEQICGHPNCNLGFEDYTKVTSHLTMDIVFSISSITLGFDPLVHFTGVTGKNSVDRDLLLDPAILEKIVGLSQYPGENIFINATPANLDEALAPRSGEIVYTQEELETLVSSFHRRGKRIGAHVGGADAIDMALKARIDVLHHAHGITEELMARVAKANAIIVATPLGGTHLAPNHPDEIAAMATRGITVAIATDSFLPPSKKSSYVYYKDDLLRGPETLTHLAHPPMVKLRENGWNENDILALITLNPARVLGIDHCCGSLEVGKDASFLVCAGVPGLEMTNPDDVFKVFFKGEKVIDKEK